MDNPRINVALDIYGSNYPNWKNAAILLAGGPGFGARKRDMLVLTPLANQVKIPFVLVDMPGAGDSGLLDQDKKPGEEGYKDYSFLWTMQNSVKWLDEIIQTLGIEQPNLIGHSAGAMLSFDYALSHPEKVKSITALSPMESIEIYTEDNIRKLFEIHPDAMRIIAACEENNDLDNPAYVALFQAWGRRHGIGVQNERTQLSIKGTAQQEELSRRLRRTPYEPKDPRLEAPIQPARII